ncbi:hypothetical protein EMIT0158MI4_10312 [Burkholderia ambifaria]
MGLLDEWRAIGALHGITARGRPFIYRVAAQSGSGIMTMTKFFDARPAVPCRAVMPCQGERE